MDPRGAGDRPDRPSFGSKDGEAAARRGITRRAFLGYTATTGALAAASPALPVLTRTVTGARPEQPAIPRPVPSFEFEEATIAELQAAMASGRLTSQRLVRAYIRRIRQIDLTGVQLNSVIEVNPDAVAIAHALDRERRSQGPRGPLHGIPILLKDNIATRDKLETTAGSLALLGSSVPRDAFLVRRLRRAGAVILGKLNLSEWANFRSFQSSSGWSGRAGQCLNPYVLDHNPCGSSSGSGSAISANLGVAALGTETDGSIVCPSTTTGLVGIKPTLGLASRSGIVPIAHSQDTGGPMARTVADAATILGVLTGVDRRDPATRLSRGKVFRNYRRFLNPNGLRGARIGVWRDQVFGFSPEADAIAEAAISKLSQLGAVVIDGADIDQNAIFEPEFTVLLYEFKADIRRYLSQLSNTSMRTLADLIEFNNEHADQEMPWFGQELFELAETFGPLTDPAYLEALATSKRLAGAEGIDRVMDQHDLDAIVSLTGSPSWTTDLVNGDHFLTASSTPPAVAGYPNITVPAGFFGELPVGINFMGRAWSEPTLIKLAYSFEQGTKVRRPPKFVSSFGVRDFIPRDTGTPVRGAEAPARKGLGHRGRGVQRAEKLRVHSL